MFRLAQITIGAAVTLLVAAGSSPAHAHLGGFGFADREQSRPVTAETIFYIASTTKAFTGLAAAIMHERGRFSLDAPLSHYLPDAVLQAPLSADSITIRSLLSHTHGIGNNGPVVWRTAFSGEFESNDELVRLCASPLGRAPASTGTAPAPATPWSRSYARPPWDGNTFVRQ